MRICVSGKIIEKTKPNKTNYSHETYSMILNNLSIDKSKKIHTKKKFFRFFTFTNVYIKDDSAHFYVAGKDDIIQDFIRHIMFNQLIRIDDMVINITSVSPLKSLPQKDKYYFKTNLIINVNIDGETQLCEDMGVVKERLIKNTLSKAEALGIQGDFRSIEIYNPRPNIEKYKGGHIRSWKSIIEIDADYDIVNMIYHVGIGENTASGHGFMWEADYANANSN